MTDQESTLTVQGRTAFAQIPVWILRAGDTLSHGAVRLYGIIMTYADNRKHTAFPERETLAKDMGASVSTVKRAIKELEDYGAITVKRRRNKRTGNFYSNHYTLVFDKPWATDDSRPRGTDDPITTPTMLTTPTSYTSEQSSEPNVSRVIPQNPTPNDSSTADPKITAAEADPISPAFYESDDRKALISNVQFVAGYRKKVSDQSKQTTDGNELGELALQLEDVITQFSNNLMIAFPDLDDYTADSMIWDYGWEPPFKASIDRFTAAKWLNKFINSLRQENGSLQWRFEKVKETA